MSLSNLLMSFCTLKDAMEDFIRRGYFSKTFLIETDACGNGTRVVLMHEGHPIAYISKTLSPKIQLLSIYEKEMLIIQLAIKKWERYLMNQPFIIKTYHQSLKYLFEQRATNLHSKHELLNSCNSTVRYRLGKGKRSR